MTATEILKSEHRVIEQVLDCLERLALQARERGQVDVSSARQILDFLKTFADKCHHAKEESHLFPLLEAHGFSRQMGPTGVMLAEHDQGRRYIRAMGDALANAGAVQAFADNAEGYVRLLRDHIAKEDHCLFPMVDSTMNEAEQQALLAAFDRVENEELRAGTHEAYLRIANELADRFGVQHAEFAATGGKCCHAGGH